MSVNAVRLGNVALMTPPRPPKPFDKGYGQYILFSNDIPQEGQDVIINGHELTSDKIISINVSQNREFVDKLDGFYYRITISFIN